jgi:hypothetical protein
MMKWLQYVERSGLENWRGKLASEVNISPANFLVPQSTEVYSLKEHYEFFLCICRAVCFTDVGSEFLYFI